MCDTCAWVEARADIEDLLEDPRYEFARDTLRGIFEWIEEHEHVTGSQLRAIENIGGSVR